MKGKHYVPVKMLIIILGVLFMFSKFPFIGIGFFTLSLFMTIYYLGMNKLEKKNKTRTKSH